MKKRLLGILLTACLLVGLLPTVALAAAPTDVGADFTADDNGAAALALLNDTKTGTDESTWDSDTNTLTLKGVNFTTSAITAVKLPAGTTIVLADGTTNTITGGDASVTGDELVPEIYGIYAEGVLTIRGETAGSGTLTVTAGSNSYFSYGIYAEDYFDSETEQSVGGKVTITGGTVSARGGAAEYSYGIFAGSIAISGGHVTAKAPDGIALDNEPTLPAAYWWRINEEKLFIAAAGGENGYLHDGSSYVEIRSICTVTLNANDGVCETASLTTNENGKLASLPTASRESYTFDGWYTAAEGGAQVTTDTVFNANTTIYAHWTSDGGDAAPTNSIGLDVSGTYTFAPADVGYGAQTSRTVTVSNTGTGATGTLSVALSGTNADAFTVSTANISSIAPGGTDSFTVVPNTGLPAGTYTATVTVDGTSVDAKSFVVSFTVSAATEYTITFDGNGGTLSATSMTTTGQKLASLPAPPRSGYIFDGWFTAVTGGDRVTVDTVFNGNTTIYAHWTAVSSGGSSSGGGSSSSSGTTTKNPDGSTTTTTTDKATGTVTETTKNTDGSTTTVETKKDGTVTETVKTADGTSGTVVTDSSGNVTEAKASVSAAAAKEAAKTGGAVTLPVEVPSASTTKDAPAVEITLSQSSGSVKVEIPVEKATPGTVAVIVKADGTEEIVSTSRVTENGVSLKLNGSTTVKVFDNAKSFNDVSASNVFYNEVCSLSAREIMVGKSGAKFDLYSSVTLNQLSNVAGRITGDVDVKDYNGGIAWGQANGLKTGNESATRGDMLSALYTAAGAPAVEDTSSLSNLNDASAIPDDMKAVTAWALQNGVLKGTADGKADLGANVTRGQACALAGRTLNTLG